jgi:hypothetical protein
MNNVLMNGKCPFAFKDELVNWASNYFKVKKTKYNKMNRKQLYAIWYKEAHLLETIQW